MATSQAAIEPLHSPRFAGLARRLAAFLLDGLLALCVVIVMSITMKAFRALGLWNPATEDPRTTWGNLEISAKGAVIFGFLLSMGAIYLPLFEASPWQASFGKRILNVHVTDTEGRRISVARAFGRWIAKLLVNWFFLWPASLITMFGTREKKALHDCVASTVVVRGQPQPGASLEAWRIAAAFGIPYVWLMGTFLIILQ
jgi:uncharacterized RDD family membrane protein YckC